MRGERCRRPPPVSLSPSCWVTALGCAGPDRPHYDLIVRDGTLIDGSGQPATVGDLAVAGDRIAAIGDLGDATADRVVDAGGLAVAPGFINMLSWAVVSLIEDGRALSDVQQGVTLEVFGEGWSMGPIRPGGEAEIKRLFGDRIEFEIEWRTLGEYLEWLTTRGVSPNVASFVGATTLRIHEIGFDDRAPTAEELERMRQLAAEAMEEGALGLGSSLIYPPAFFADTDELIALAGVVSRYGGRYISHMRSEGNRVLESVEELIRIAREASVGAEIYHLKLAGRNNWGKFDAVIAAIEAARADGLDITADIYPYVAGSTGLTASLPPWSQDGGHDALIGRLRDPSVRARIVREMTTPTDDWENLYLGSGADGILLTSFENQALFPLVGRTLAEVAAERGRSPAETICDLIVEDDSRVGAIYFMMAEENLLRKAALPWVSFGSDEAAPAPEGVFLESNPHPRAYGTFARVLGPYARELGLFPLEQAVRRMTALPAENLGITDRGRLEPGYYADVVVFDPARVADRATYEEPHQLAVGVEHVFVNGVQVLADGEHTGALPGRVVRGPGTRGPETVPRGRHAPNRMRRPDEVQHTEIDDGTAGVGRPGARAHRLRAGARSAAGGPCRRGGRHRGRRLAASARGEPVPAGQAGRADR